MLYVYVHIYVYMSMCVYRYMYNLLNQYTVLICAFHIITWFKTEHQDLKKNATKQFLNCFLCCRYEGLDHALQCADYLQHDEKNVGCKLSNLDSSDYKDFFICVNGSSKLEPIRSSYTVFQLQNIGDMSKWSQLKTCWFSSRLFLSEQKMQEKKSEV